MNCSGNRSYRSSVPAGVHILEITAVYTVRFELTLILSWANQISPFHHLVSIRSSLCLVRSRALQPSVFFFSKKRWALLPKAIPYHRIKYQSGWKHEDHLFSLRYLIHQRYASHISDESGDAQARKMTPWASLRSIYMIPYDTRQARKMTKHWAAYQAYRTCGKTEY